MPQISRRIGVCGPDPILYALIIAIIALVVVSLLTKKTDEKILDETHTGFYLQPRALPAGAGPVPVSAAKAGVQEMRNNPAESVLRSR